MVGCTECLGCNDLTNKSYCIENIEYPRNEYLDRKIDYLRDKYRPFPQVIYRNRESEDSL